MADFQQPRIPEMPSIGYGGLSQPPVPLVAQTNPLQSLTQGGVQGFSLGLQARQIAALEAEQKQKAIKDQVDTIKAYGELHTKYEDVPSMQKKLISNGLIPAQNRLADLIGYGPAWHINPSDINYEDDKDSLKEIYASANLLGAGQITPEQHFNNLRTIQEHHAGQKKVIGEVEKQFADTMQMEQLKSLEENRKNENQDRDENRALRVETAKQGIITHFNSDPSIKKHQQEIDYADDVKTLATSGNPIAAGAIPTYMARASGEVGNLSEADKRPFGGSRAILDRMNQAFTEMSTGKLSDKNRDFIVQMTELMKNNASKNMDVLAKSRSKQYAKDSPYFKEEEIFGALRPDYNTQNSTQDSEYEKDKQDAAIAISKGLVTAQEAAKRLRQKYPGKGH